jgi:hypothetical protein
MTSRRRWIAPGIPLAAAACLLMLTTTPAAAGELRVQAPVVDVEAISAPPVRVEHCDDRPVNASLSRILAWDLGLNCRTELVASEAITGYRVFYRWDDRVYSQVMASRPGATIPLKVRID